MKRKFKLQIAAINQNQLHFFVVIVVYVRQNSIKFNLECNVHFRVIRGDSCYYITEYAITYAYLLSFAVVLN